MTNVAYGVDNAPLGLAKDLLRTMPQHRVPFLWGPPGIGKTDIVNQVAGEEEADVVVLKASELQREDLVGIPFPYEEGWTKFHPIQKLLELCEEYPELHRKHFENNKRAELDEYREQLRREMHEEIEALTQQGVDREEIRETREELEAGIEEKLEARGEEIEAGYTEPDTGKKVLFLDEFSNAEPDMMAPFQYLTLNRKVGGIEGYTLRDNVRIIAAGNRQQDLAATSELTTPMKNRLEHIEVEEDFESWVSWAHSNDIHPHVIAFLRRNRGRFMEFEPRDVDKTYPSPRSWAMVSEALTHLDELDLEGERGKKLRRYHVTGLVGKGAAGEFFKFEEVAMGAPTAEEVIDDPEGLDPFNDKPDIALVVIENLISAVRENAEKYVDGSLLYVARMHAEYQTLFHTAVMNQQGDMPEEAMLRIIRSDHWETVRSNIQRMNEVRDKTQGAAGDRSGESLGL